MEYERLWGENPETRKRLEEEIKGMKNTEAIRYLGAKYTDFHFEISNDKNKVYDALIILSIVDSIINNEQDKVERCKLLECYTSGVVEKTVNIFSDKIIKKFKTITTKNEE